MHAYLLFLWLGVVYCQKNATNTTTKETAFNNVVVNIVKMSRDSPRPFVAYNQGSFTPPFPAIARIRSKTKSTSADTTNADSETTGRNVRNLANSLEHPKSSKGAFTRKASLTGSTYNSFPFQSEYTGDPYLKGYGGLPETQETSSNDRNYMGALTRSNQAGKHTFGSYGTYANNMDYGGKYSIPTTVYNSPEPVYSSRPNPYSATYQSGSDSDYAANNRYSNNDYSNYGSQMGNGLNTQWNGQGYEQQGYSNLPAQGYQNSQMQSYSTQQPSWPQQGYQTAQNAYSQNSYSNIEDMPNTGYMGYQNPSSTYSTPSVNRGFIEEPYSVGNGDSYGRVNQQNYNYGSYSGTGGQTGYVGASSQSGPSYAGSTYSIPSSSSSTYSNDNDYLQQGSYGSNNAWTQYNSLDSNRYQTTYEPSWNYGTSDVQTGGSSGYDYYKPTQQYGTAQNYGNNFYQTNTYSPVQTAGDYGTSYGTDYGYPSDAQQGQFMNYGRRPEMEFTMNVGYGSSRAGKGVRAKPALTNSITPPGADDDGYRNKKAK